MPSKRRIAAKLTVKLQHEQEFARMMNRGSVFSGVLAVALWATLDTAEAKLVRYEINGQRYSYSTNNRQQVREARQRIQAAQEAA